MSTLQSVRERVADQLARSDLSSQITTEIQAAIRRYNRRPRSFTEARGGVITAVANEGFYSTIDFSGAAGSMATTALTAYPVRDVVSFSYIRGSSDDYEVERIDYRTFERLRDNTTPGSFPTFYAVYADQVCFWPYPTSAQTFTVSAVIKPPVPTQDSEGSVWFDKAEELIVERASEMVALKYLKDPEESAMYGADRVAEESEILAESNRSRSTGLKARM